MNVDFIRHIVNPVLNKYMVNQEKTRVLIEVKKLFQQSEEVYRFSIYNGDPRNLAAFLKSNDFTRIVNILKSAGMTYLITEILSEALASYSGIKEVEEALNQALDSLKRETQVETGGGRKEDVISMLESMLKNTNLFKQIERGRNSLTAETHSGWLLRVSSSKKGYKLKIDFTKNYRGSETSELMEEVVRIAEWINSLRL